MKNTTAERNRATMAWQDYLHYRRGARGLFRAHNRRERFYRGLDLLVPGLGSLARLLGLD